MYKFKLHGDKKYDYSRFVQRVEKILDQSGITISCGGDNNIVTFCAEFCEDINETKFWYNTIHAMWRYETSLMEEEKKAKKQDADPKYKIEDIVWVCVEKDYPGIKQVIEAEIISFDEIYHTGYGYTNKKIEYVVRQWNTNIGTRVYEDNVFKTKEKAIESCQRVNASRLGY